MEAFLNSPLGRTNLTSNVLTIGRAPDNQLVLQDNQASGHHAEIRPEGQGYTIVDTGSRNGTFVNEQPLTPQIGRALNSGDVVRIGNTKFTYELAGSYDATMRAAPGDFGSPGFSPAAPAQPPAANYGQDFSAYAPPVPPAPAYPQQDYQPSYPQQQPAYPYNQPAQQTYPQPAAYPQQQPWGAPAAAPGQFAGVPAQPRRRGRAGLIIGLIVLILIILGGAFAAFAYVNRSTPTKTLQAYCTALQNNDAHGAYILLSTRAQGQENEQTFTQRFAQTEEALRSPLVGGLKSCTVSNVQENGAGATGTITLAVNNTSATVPLNVTLVKESSGLFGSWKMDQATTPSQQQ